jgi:hypothetical protein
MSEPENVLARWSRLKREKEKKPAAEPAPPAAPQQADTPVAADKDKAAAAATPASAASSPAFDPATLPPVESITAASDVRSFLQTGVPAELTRAALRRAWSADPAIRDFIGLVENDWDFTDPTAIPGFGTFEPNEDMRKLISQAIGEVTDPAPPDEAPTAAEPAPPPAAVSQTPQVPGTTEKMPEDSEAASGSAQQDEVIAAPQPDEVPAKIGNAPNRRSHGRAMPQ